MPSIIASEPSEAKNKGHVHKKAHVDTIKHDSLR